VRYLMASGTKPKYCVGDVVLHRHGIGDRASWVGGRILAVYPKSEWHLDDQKKKYFKYRISLPPELVFGEWVEMCEHRLRRGKESDIEYKGKDRRKDPALQQMIGFSRMSMDNQRMTSPFGR
jgi:hypothetical protein